MYFPVSFFIAYPDQRKQTGKPRLGNMSVTVSTAKHVPTRPINWNAPTTLFPASANLGYLLEGLDLVLKKKDQEKLEKFIVY